MESAQVGVVVCAGFRRGGSVAQPISSDSRFHGSLFQSSSVLIDHICTTAMFAARLLFAVALLASCCVVRVTADYLLPERVKLIETSYSVYARHGLNSLPALQATRL